MRVKERFLILLINLAGGKQMSDFLSKVNAALMGSRTTILLWTTYVSTFITWVNDSLVSITDAGVDSGLIVAAVISSIKTLITSIIKARAS